ncbi:hypothetical protein ACOSP7_027579 [Xanthoceras sorbifolium]
MLRYIKGTANFGISFTPAATLKLEAFVDVDWASCPVDRKSTSEYCVFLGGNLLTWSYKKQTLLLDLVPIIWCDNLGAKSLAQNPVFHSRTKHIEIDVHFVRGKVANNQVEVCYVPTGLQIADILTKNLPISRFAQLRFMLTVVSSQSSLREDDSVQSSSSDGAVRTSQRGNKVSEDFLQTDCSSYQTPGSTVKKKSNTQVVSQLQLTANSASR